MFLGLIPSCVNDGGVEIPNEVVGKEFIAGKGAASQAEIKLVPVGYVPGAQGPDSGRGALVSGVTDASGRFSFKNVVPGQYNVLVSKDGMNSFRDSITITGKGQDLSSDTLKVPGALYGTVVIEPNHDTRMATIQVLGTTNYVNVDQQGHFSLNGLGAGTYRLRLVVGIDGYSPLFQETVVHSGKTDTLLPMRPFYSLTPVVIGLSAMPNSDGTIKVKWNRSEYANTDGYLIYRDSAGTILPSQNAITRTADTFFVDTIYSKQPKKGQYDYLDTATRPFTYRVRILDRSGDPGPGFNSALVTAYPPGKQFVSGQWHQAVASAAFSKRSGSSVFSFKDKLWLVGGQTLTGIKNDIWSSADGIIWNKVIDSIPIPDSLSIQKVLVFQNKIWVIVFHNGLDKEELFFFTSQDGLTWTKLRDSLPITGRSAFSLATHADRLWIMDGFMPGYRNLSNIKSTRDGSEWTELNLPITYNGSGNEGVASFAGSLWRIGGGLPLPEALFPLDIWKTSDGMIWEKAADTSTLLPRFGQTLVASEKRLFSIGGSIYIPNLLYPLNFPDPSDEVWSSPNGTDWSLMDAHAPYGKRNGFSTCFFSGKLWVIGGATSSSGSEKYLNDIWYMDVPN